MNILIDISHPAHVHFYRHIRRELINRGSEVVVVARDKDVTLDLLDAFGIDHLKVGRAGHKGWVGQFGELVQRDAFLVRKGLKFNPDVVLTRNPSGVQAARMLGSIGVFDTDDGRSVGIHYRAAAPFAHWITAPDCLTESFGDRGRKYPSYKALAYLHPDVFEPDPDIGRLLGADTGEPYALVRLVAHDASHDRAARGLNAEAARRLVTLIERSMRVFVSSETTLDDTLGTRQLKVAPDRMHDVLAGASIVVGDSQSVIAEAALLGTPAVRINSYAGATPYLVELEHRFGLAYSFPPDEISLASEKVSCLIEDESTRDEWGIRRTRMLDQKVNLVDWYVDFVSKLAG